MLRTRRALSFRRKKRGVCAFFGICFSPLLAGRLRSIRLPPLQTGPGSGIQTPSSERIPGAEQLQLPSCRRCRELPPVSVPPAQNRPRDRGPAALRALAAAERSRQGAGQGPGQRGTRLSPGCSAQAGEREGRRPPRRLWGCAGVSSSPGAPPRCVLWHLRTNRAGCGSFYFPEASPGRGGGRRGRPRHRFGVAFACKEPRFRPGRGPAGPGGGRSQSRARGRSPRPAGTGTYRPGEAVPQRPELLQAGVPPQLRRPARRRRHAPAVSSRLRGTTGNRSGAPGSPGPPAPPRSGADPRPPAPPPAPRSPPAAPGSAAIAPAPAAKRPGPTSPPPPPPHGLGAAMAEQPRLAVRPAHQNAAPSHWASEDARLASSSIGETVRLSNRTVSLIG